MLELLLTIMISRTYVMVRKFARIVKMFYKKRGRRTLSAEGAG